MQDLVDAVVSIAQVTKDKEKADITQGLLLAQLICRRRLLESFDSGCSSAVLLIMDDIVKVMEGLNGSN